MMAVEISKPGGPEVLKPAKASIPQPQAGEVLIRVAAAGVNRPDVLQRQGNYPVPPGASPLPGLEVAGVIETPVGLRFSKGDKVVALTNGGGYAEFVAVPEGQVLPLPKGYSFAEGAALPETLFTVQQTMMDKAALGTGQTVLIHGGSGGIGGAAIQLAVLAGAKAFATVSSPEKAAYAKKMGASATIDYNKEDFVARLQDLTNGQGANVILDIVGGAYLNRNLQALARGGTLIQLALLAGAKAEVNLGLVLSKHLTVFGSTLRPRSAAEKAVIARHLFEQVWPALEDGRMHKPDLRIFDLTEAAAAHAAIDGPDHLGKIVLVTQFGQQPD